MRSCPVPVDLCNTNAGFETVLQIPCRYKNHRNDGHLFNFTFNPCMNKAIRSIIRKDRHDHLQAVG